MTEQEELSKVLRQLLTGRVKRSNEGQWIIDHLDAPELKAAAAELSMLGFHILADLENQDLTGIELAEKLHASRGGITRAAQNLLKYDLIRTHQKRDDKKKLYYRLTDKGRRLNTVHSEMHQKIDAYRKRELYDKYDEAEKALILRFLEDAVRVEQEMLD